MPAGNTTRVSWVRVARRARGLSQYDLADLVDLDQSTLSKIENNRTKSRTGERQVLEIVKRAIARALEYEVAELFPPEGKPSPNKDLRRLAASMNGKVRR